MARVVQSPAKPAAFVALSLIIAVAVLLISPLAGQNDATANPVAASPATIQEGASLFRTNCSPCHGPNAKGGGRGPDLTSGRWVHGSSDTEIFHTITTGVPGTEMPANGIEYLEVWTIITYLRSLAPPKTSSTTGDRLLGEQFFEQKGCSNCHMVKGKGGLLGPDLSRVGAGRSAAYLAESIRQPDKELSAAMIDPNSHFGPPLVWNTVTVVTATGEKIVGMAKNEDTFSIQLMDRRQNLHLLLKRNLKQITHQQKSLMPAYPEDVLSATELDHLVAYLESLRQD